MIEMLDFFPCVALLGARQCGKTTLLSFLPENWKIFDLEKSNDFDQISSDPELFLRIHSKNIAIDEAQLCPKLFNALRVTIDQNRELSGRFIITGSSSPELIKSISESLAGRVAVIEMAPLTFKESQQSFNNKFFDLLVSNGFKNKDNLLNLIPTGDINKVLSYWLRGGYPEPWLKSSSRFRKIWMDNYVKTYLERDLKKLFPALDENRYKLFLQMLSSLSGNIINYSEVARALGVSSPTIRDYFYIADKTFLWRVLPSYEKNATKRVIKHPKGYFRDSGLVNHLLRIVDQDQLLSHPSRGQLWEGVVIEEIIRSLKSRSISFDYFYYRTSAGAEIDLILEGEFGLIPIEIKHTSKVAKKDLRTIITFMEQRKCRIGFVINNDEAPRIYNDNLIGIPFNYL